MKYSIKNNYPIFIIVLIPIVLHIPIWIGIVDFYSGDASDLIPYFYGTKSLLCQTFHNNLEIPLWNPYIMFGQPIVGNIQYSLFYPFNFIFLFIPFFKAVTFYQVIHLIAAGLGTYYLGQYIACKKIGSMLAALLMILNGRYIYYISAGWFTYFTSICWIPFFLLFSLRVIEKKDLYNTGCFSIIFALTFLSGTPQYAFLGFCLFLIHGISHLFLVQSRNNRLQILFRLSFTALISFLIIGIQLFPAIEQTYLSTRPLLEDKLIGFHFQWDLKQWIRILFRPEFLRRDFAWELCAYIGIAGILLSFFGLIYNRKNYKLVCIWGIIPWLLSMGSSIPILSSMTKMIPGISILTNPSRYFIFSILVLCLMAGQGLDYILDLKRYKNTTFILLSGACIGLLIAGVIVKPYHQSTELISIHFIYTILIFFFLASLHFWRRTNLFKFLLICWIIIDPGYIAMEVLLKERYYIKDLPPPSKIIEALNGEEKYPRIASIQSKDAWNNNLLTPFEDWICIDQKIARASGYEPLGMLKTHRFASRMDGTYPMIKSIWGFRLWSFSNYRLFDIGGITHLITSEPLNNPRLKLITEDIIATPHFHGGWWSNKSLYLYENKYAYPRAFLLRDNKKANVMPINFKIISPNHRRLNFHTDTPGTVVISESFHTGWIARGKRDDIYLRPFLDTFISFDVPAGEHDIKLDFKPQSLYIGSMFTVAGLILITLCFLYKKQHFFDNGNRNQSTR